MHEMAIAQSILELVEEHAQKDHFDRVRTLRIAIGALSHVDPTALEFGFEVVARGTVADGAKLVIERPAGIGYCTDCCKTIAVERLGDPCPSCSGFKWMVTAGDDMRVVDLEVT